VAGALEENPYEPSALVGVESARIARGDHADLEIGARVLFVLVDGHGIRIT